MLTDIALNQSSHYPNKHSYSSNVSLINQFTGRSCVVICHVCLCSGGGSITLSPQYCYWLCERCLMQLIRKCNWQLVSRSCFALYCASSLYWFRLGRLVTSYKYGKYMPCIVYEQANRQLRQRGQNYTNAVHLITSQCIKRYFQRCIYKKKSWALLHSDSHIQ